MTQQADISKSGRALVRYPLYSVKHLTCNEIAKALDGDRVLMGCEHCCLFVYEDECEATDVLGQRKCPKCDRLDLVQMSEDALADMVVTGDGYRVCEHCRFAFFWSDEVVVRDEGGNVLVRRLDGSPAYVPEEDAGGEALYVCPGCGKHTS